jgi:hypothetical protein
MLSKLNNFLKIISYPVTWLAGFRSGKRSQKKNEENLSNSRRSALQRMLELYNDKR